MTISDDLRHIKNRRDKTFKLLFYSCSVGFAHEDL